MLKNAKRKSAGISVLLCCAAVALAAVAVFGIWHTVAAGFTRDDQPSGSDWALTLVNETHHVPAGWNVELTTLSNGEQVDSRMYPYLQQMFDDMRDQGVYPFVRAGYRSAGDQRKLLRKRILSAIQEGASFGEAIAGAEKYVAEPGTSEHELGLAVDINADLDRSTSDEVYGWLAQNAWKYGFVLRYPADKTDITGIDYEPWHYRYVGQEAAKEMHKKGLCLEEYLGAAG